MNKMLVALEAMKDLEGVLVCGTVTFFTGKYLCRYILPHSILRYDLQCATLAIIISSKKSRFCYYNYKIIISTGRD